jgi:hypothetical protein
MTVYWEKMVKKILRGNFLDPLKWKLNDWEDVVKQVSYGLRPYEPPPHIVKVKAVLDSAQRHGIELLIETGTFEGEMVRKCHNKFRDIYTIELDPKLADRARNRLGRYKNIQIIQGDSAELLNGLLLNIKIPAVFWLDAHYSGGITAKSDKETPLLEELEAIWQHGIGEHVILIDDIRLLDTENYPTKDEVIQKLLDINPDYTIQIKADILRCEPVKN